MLTNTTCVTNTQTHGEAMEAFSVMKSASVCLVGACCSVPLQQLYSEVSSYLPPDKSLLLTTGSEKLLLLSLEVHM